MLFRHSVGGNPSVYHHAGWSGRAEHQTPGLLPTALYGLALSPPSLSDCLGSFWCDILHWDFPGGGGKGQQLATSPQLKSRERTC